MTLTPSTQTGILHAALAELGSTERPISIDDTTSNTARRAKTLWNDLVREQLALHPWNFAIRRAQLNAAGAAPTHGWQRGFLLPADCIRWLPYADTDSDWRAAEREGDYLLSDAAAPLPIRYIAAIDDVTRWSAPFVKLVTLQLAASLAEAVTQSESIKDRVLERAEAALRKAKRMDGLETGQRRRSAVVGRSDILRGRSRAYGWRRG